MRTQYTPKIIFSVENKSNSYHENYNHTHDAKTALTMAGVIFVEGTGVYKGGAERCLIVKDTEQNREAVLKLASHYLQESILLIDNEGTGYLHYLGSDKQHRLGRYVVTSMEPSGDYTKIGDDFVTFN